MRAHTHSCAAAADGCAVCGCRVSSVGVCRCQLPLLLLRGCPPAQVVLVNRLMDQQLCVAEEQALASVADAAAFGEVQKVQVGGA